MKMMSHRDDEEIINQCLAGDKEVFSLLVDRYKKPMVMYIYGMVKNYEEANDLTQETFIKVYKNLWKYNSQHKFSSWLYQIAKNTALDFLRKSKEIPTEQSFLSEFESDRGNPEETAYRDETRSEIIKAMDALPSHLRAILALHHLNGLSYAEISKTLGLPNHTVKNRLFQARKKLKEKLVRMEVTG
ncbi:RNA polymerase sigma factor [Metallumcola ferriviriculae]|uniref:RNA polymerase sigma factor n=1 Tax=Metallumcola ferriviriculae TaxID=3039180 RepID=A0AAU0URL1_9FIRM|nr:RNA polymerase sigma factor [Desulfitibacteraceae bacterium MK1]